ncbi:hypothetical protein D3C74_348030 [compost metagenome]
MNDQHLPRLPGCFHDRFAVQGLQRTQIENMRADPLLRSYFFRGLHRKMQRQAVTDNRNIAAFAKQVCLADRYHVIVLRHILFDQLVAFFVLKE